MPRQVKAYGCEFKCGQKVVVSKASMISHESRCFHNPTKRACITCKHFERIHDSNGMEGSSYLEEWVDLICRAKDECMDKLQNNCELHGLKQSHTNQSKITE